MLCCVTSYQIRHFSFENRHLGFFRKYKVNYAFNPPISVVFHHFSPELSQDNYCVVDIAGGDLIWVFYCNDAVYLKPWYCSSVKLRQDYWLLHEEEEAALGKGMVWDWFLHIFLLRESTDYWREDVHVACCCGNNWLLCFHCTLVLSCIKSFWKGTLFYCFHSRKFANCDTSPNSLNNMSPSKLAIISP